MSRGVLEPSYRKRTAYQAMLLGGMATFATATLVLGDLHTREDIALRRAEDLQANLRQVVPPALHDNDMTTAVLELPAADGASRTVYQAMHKGAVSAVAFETVGYGYAGAITCLMAVDRDGKVLGVRVLAHAETPGLGDKIEASKDDWVLAFDGRSLGNPPPGKWAVKKDGGVFDQFTGATITPRAVVTAVKQGLEYFHANRLTLLRPPEAMVDAAAVVEAAAKETGGEAK